MHRGESGDREVALVDITFDQLELFLYPLERRAKRAALIERPALELEVGVSPVAEWYMARNGKALIHYGASAGHIPARMAVMRDTGSFLPRAISSESKCGSTSMRASIAAKNCNAIASFLFCCPAHRALCLQPIWPFALKLLPHKSNPRKAGNCAGQACATAPRFFSTMCFVR